MSSPFVTARYSTTFDWACQTDIATFEFRTCAYTGLNSRLMNSKSQNRHPSFNRRIANCSPGTNSRTNCKIAGPEILTIGSLVSTIGRRAAMMSL